MKRFLSLVLLIASHSFAFPSRAQDFAVVEPQGQLLQQLNLSRTQLQQMRSIRQRNQPEIARLRDQVQQLRQEMEELLVSDASTQEIRAKFSQLKFSQEKKEERQLEQMLAIRDVLNVQQRSRLRELIEQRRGQFRSRPR